jgi:hypothetical protein
MQPLRQAFHIPFHAGAIAKAIRVPPDINPARALDALRLPPFRGVIVMHGGAGGMSSEDVRIVRQALVAGLAPVAQRDRLLVIDGGTRAGAMQAMGDARIAVGGTYPLLGVCPAGAVSYPGGPAPSEEHAPLDAGHTHFLLVEGDAFGVESALLVGLLRASGKPGVALIVNGGDIVEQELEIHLKGGSPVVVLGGSGRLADRLADPASEARAALPAAAHLDTIDVTAPDDLRARLARLLDQSPGAGRS